MSVYDAVLAQVGAAVDATEAFYESADGYAYAVEADADPAVVDRNREHAVRDWIAAEEQRLSLDWVVHDLAPTFTIETRDEDGETERTEMTARSLQEFFHYSMGGLGNMTGMDPHRRYTDEEAGEAVAALQVAYDDVHALQRTYLDALEVLLDHPSAVHAKLERSPVDSFSAGFREEYAAVEDTMAAWVDKGYTPV